jgi:hypothetical protein
MEGTVRKLLSVAVLAAALALSGCAVSDRYGNTYGGFYNPGDHYAWQLQTCDQEIAASAIAEPQKKRAMQCCMWRHGVPIDDSTGCTAG